MRIRQQHISSKTALVVGFSCILLFVLVSLVVGRYLINEVILAQREIIEVHSLKKDASLKMWAYAQRRFLRASMMFHTRDEFIIDDLKMDRSDAGGLFIAKFQQLRDLPLTDLEEKLLTKLRAKVRFSANLVDEIISLIDEGKFDIALQLFDNLGYDSQKDVYESLTEFGELQERYVENTVHAIDGIKQRYQYWQLLLTLSLIVIGGLLARFIIRQITSTEYQLVKERKQAMTTLGHISDSVISVDSNQAIDYINPAGEWLLDCSSRSIVGKKLHQVLVLYNDRRERIATEFLDKNRDFPRSSTYLGQQLLVYNERGENVFIELEVTNYFRDGHKELLGYVVVIKDITKERESVLALERQANTDLLTGLVNKFNFEQRLDKVLKSDRHGESYLVFFMDLDKFKVINDTCGHQAGDKLLREVARLFLHNTRQSDVLARVGGDEFAILLRNCCINEGAVIAGNLIEALSTYRFVWEGELYSLGVSIGITDIQPSFNASVEEVLNLADVACYRAKSKGRNTSCICTLNDKDILKKAAEVNWSKRIVKAIDEDGFSLFGQVIQPTSACLDEVDQLVEVLIRYRDEQGEMISPAVFLPAAERYHLMVDLDSYVVNKVFKFIQQNGGYHQENIKICINLSGQTVGNSRALALILSKIEQYDIRPGLICFEITETAAITNLAEATKFIQAIKSAGCLFALDDFGSGVSSFAYLQSLPVDYLKIDGDLITQITSSEVQYHIIEAVHRMGDIMGLRTVAEYIESPDILTLVEKIGIHYGQGYYLGKPASIESVLQSMLSEDTELMSKNYLKINE